MYLIGIILFLALLCSSLMLTGSLSAFIDLPSITIILAFTLPMLLSSGLFQDFKRAFKIAMAKQNNFSVEVLKKSLLAVELTIKLVLVSSVLGFIIGLIGLLRNLSDPALIGPNTAMAIITVFYAMFCTIIFMPIQAKIKMFLVESKED